MLLRSYILMSLAGLAGLQGQNSIQGFQGGSQGVGYLGVGYRDVTSESANALHLPEEVGVELTRLIPGSPAAQAGLREGDVVVQYNGERVEGQVQLNRLISETPPGRQVKIQVYRNGYVQNLVAKIGSRPAGPPIKTQFFSLGPSGAGAFPDVALPRTSWRNGLGAEWETLDGQLAAYFGVPQGGVLVRSVMNGSVAELAGLRAGDVIVRAADAKVSTPADLSARIRAERAQVVTVTIVRERKEMNLTIPLDGSRPGQ